MARTAAWRKSFRPASFKGAAFFIDSHDFETGRRVVLHEYPDIDYPDDEDLGKKSGAFTLAAYIVGEDYWPARDALLKACETKGAGLLVHPYLGEKQVVCLGCQLREATSEGNVARYKLTFREVGVVPEADTVPDYEALVDESVSDLNEAALEAFQEEVDATGPDYLLEGLQNDIKTFFNKMRATVATVANQVKNNIVTDLLDLVDTIDDEIGDAAGDLYALGTAIQYRLEGLGKLVTYSRTFAAVELGIELLAWTQDAPTVYLPYIPLTTPDRKQQKKNREEALALLRKGLIGALATSAMGATYESYDQAEYVREVAGGALEDAANAAGEIGDDTTYRRVETVRVHLSRALSEKSGGLPKVRWITTPPHYTDTLNLAYDLYEDLGREEEIIRRNKAIKHPGFIPGGTELEVLSE